MKYCYVFDYLEESIYCIDLSSIDLSKYEDDDAVIRCFGLNPDSCSWMFTDEQVDCIHI